MQFLKNRQEKKNTIKRGKARSRQEQVLLWMLISQQDERTNERAVIGQVFDRTVQLLSQAILLKLT